MLSETKELYQSMLPIMDVVDQLGDEYPEVREHLLGMKLKEIFLAEIFNFSLYLTASDGTLAPAELAYLNDLFDCSFTAEDVVKLIYKGSGYDIANSIPRSLEISFLADVLIVATHNEEDPVHYPLYLTIIDLYEAIGADIIICDGEATDKEKRDLKDYVQMLNDYIDATIDEMGE